MTADELKSMPKGQFIVMKTGAHPMKVKLKLFFQWGISFGAPYTVPDKGNRPVAYAGKGEPWCRPSWRKYPPAPIVAEVEDERQENSSGQQASAAASPKAGQKPGKKQGQQQTKPGSGSGAHRQRHAAQ